MAWCKGVIVSPRNYQTAIDVIFTSGSPCSYLSTSTAEKLGLDIQERPQPRVLQDFLGVSKYTITHTANVTIKLKQIVQQVTVELVPFEGSWLGLGSDWFRKNGVRTSWDGDEYNVLVKDEEGNEHNVTERDTWPVAIVPAVFWVD